MGRISVILLQPKPRNKIYLVYSHDCRAEGAFRSVPRFPRVRFKPVLRYIYVYMIDRAGAVWRVGRSMCQSPRDLRFGLSMLLPSLRTIRTEFSMRTTVLVLLQPDPQRERMGIWGPKTLQNCWKIEIFGKMKVIFRPIRDLLNRLGVVSERLGQFLRSKIKDLKKKFWKFLEKYFSRKKNWRKNCENIFSFFFVCPENAESEEFRTLGVVFRDFAIPPPSAPPCRARLVLVVFFVELEKCPLDGGSKRFPLGVRIPLRMPSMAPIFGRFPQIPPKS